MKHFTEHTLDLFVLSAPEVESEREAIELHLKECYGCRSMVEQLQGFYNQLDREFESSLYSDQLQEPGIIDIPIHPDRHYSLQKNTTYPAKLFTMYPTHHQPQTIVGRFWRLVRQHPVSVGIGSVGFVAIAAAMLSFASKNFNKDINPDFYKNKPALGMLEIYNARSEKLWELPVQSEALLGADETWKIYHTRKTVTADLDNDGKNEVLTILNGIGSETNHDDSLHIYSSNRSLLKVKKFGKSVTFNGKLYEDNFGMGGLVVDDFLYDGTKSILVSAGNERSPFVVTRLDAQVNWRGEYWHFGHLGAMSAIDLFGNGKKELVLCGLNDVENSPTNSYPVIVVLDPTKIVGESESTASPGFGFAQSDAEICYVRLPRTDINQVLYSTLAVVRADTVRSDSLEVLDIWAWSSSIDREPKIEFIFSKEMRPLAVRLGDGAIRLREQLVNEGKLKGKSDQAYLDSIKAGIRYWDGRKWQKEVTMVQHADPTASR